MLQAVQRHFKMTSDALAMCLSRTRPGVARCCLIVQLEKQLSPIVGSLPSQLANAAHRKFEGLIPGPADRVVGRDTHSVLQAVQRHFKMTSDALAMCSSRTRPWAPQCGHSGGTRKTMVVSCTQPSPSKGA